MPIHFLSVCSPCVSREPIFISKAAKATHKIFKIYGLAGEALLFLANFFSFKAILLNLQAKSHGLVGNYSIYATDVENLRFDTVELFQKNDKKNRSCKRA